METRFLFPNKFKKIGLLSTVFSLLLFSVVLLFDEELLLKFPVFTIWSLGNSGNSTLFGFVEHDLSGTVSGILIILSLTLTAFSREKNEDEYITKLRLESLIWSVYLNIIFLLFCLFFFYGWPFALILVFNLYSILFIFILRFNFVLYKSKRLKVNEK
ncbi:MAG: hypothetical protein HW421_767 [Ignavibacteria bacterium]|nr:hypothetical protein [Ignavibacteria bacterium]